MTTTIRAVAPANQINFALAVIASKSLRKALTIDGCKWVDNCLCGTS